MEHGTWALEDTYTDCEKLRYQNLRLTKLDSGSTNIGSNGHPQNSGAVDRRTLCIFQPRDQVCQGTAAVPQGQSNRTRQVAVRKATVQQQINGSYRSFERGMVRRTETNNKRMEAQCRNVVAQSMM